MSRTDRHRPYRVQLTDPTERNRATFDGQTWLLHRACGHGGCSLRPESRAQNRRERRFARRLGRVGARGPAGD